MRATGLDLLNETTTFDFAIRSYRMIFSPRDNFRFYEISKLSARLSDECLILIAARGFCEVFGKNRKQRRGIERAQWLVKRIK